MPSNHQVVIITGAAGFLGSAITVNLAHRYQVVAIDRREPTETLEAVAPSVIWQQVDIADESGLADTFKKAGQLFGRIDFVVHLAAFYHFGLKWHPEYERTNLRGTANVLRSAMEAGVNRLIFTSSIAAMRPPPLGKVLTERSPTTDCIPYGKSKSIGEDMVRHASNKLPSIILRIGGVFSDWCELPPLYSLIKLWAGRSPLSRIIVGHGKTGFPYIHRNDVVQFVRNCIERNEVIANHEVLFASDHGSVNHMDLFPIIHGASTDKSEAGPIFISPAIAQFGLFLKLILGHVTRKLPYERPWMLQYIDHPWIVDTTYTQEKLGRSLTDGMGIRDRLPTIMKHFVRSRPVWEQRNRLRNKALYSYYEDSASL
jgi:nucleoside-diphosphate-sugar epimerase